MKTHTPFTHTALYRRAQTEHRKVQLYPSVIVLTSMLLSIASPLGAESHCETDEKEFIVTAYYSPLPDQKHYVLGDYEADIAFNGRGIKGASGTDVYPGMIAAPQSYPFGTRIEFPELGVTGTVHDRGSMIVSGDDGIDRLDIWMGKGEEGLARAMAWGVQRVKGVVHKPTGLPEESFDLAKFPAPERVLKYLPNNPIAMQGIDDPLYGDTSAQVAALQYALQKLGYLDHDITNYYGPKTKDAMARFQRDVLIPLHGERADERTRMSLLAHRTLAEQIRTPLTAEESLVNGTSGKQVRVAQRLLKLLGEETGEIDGEYDQQLMSTIYQFQSERNIVSSLADSGAGIVGPQTKRALLTAWREYRIGKKGGSLKVASL